MNLSAPSPSQNVLLTALLIPCLKCPSVGMMVWFCFAVMYRLDRQTQRLMKEKGHGLAFINPHSHWPATGLHVFWLKFDLIVKFIFKLSVFKPSNCNQIWKNYNLPLELNYRVPMFWKNDPSKCNISCKILDPTFSPLVLVDGASSLQSVA